MNATNLVYRPQPSIRDNYVVRVKVRPNAVAEEAKVASYRMLLETISLQILANDVLTELVNMPEVKGRFRSYFKDIFGKLNHARVCLKRRFGDIYYELENSVCEIVDESEKHTKWCIVMIEDVLAGKVSYVDMKVAARVGFIGGLIDILNQLHKAMTGKSSSDYSQAYETLKLIDRRFDFQSLNEGKDPDYDKAKESMVRMFCELGVRCKEKAYKDLNVKE